MTKVSPKRKKNVLLLIPDIDHCINATCKNGGSCVDGLRNYSCVCSAGFMGDQCETGILDFRFKLALTNLMWSSKVIFKPIKIYSKVIHLYLQKKILPIPYPLSDGKITNETYGGKLMIYHAPWSFLLKVHSSRNSSCCSRYRLWPKK